MKLPKGDNPRDRPDAVLLQRISAVIDRSIARKSLEDKASVLRRVNESAAAIRGGGDSGHSMTADLHYAFGKLLDVQVYDGRPGESDTIGDVVEVTRGMISTSIYELLRMVSLSDAATILLELAEAGTREAVTA